jgi:uncharacterized protein YdcH (DUF465 family)|tara:strand:- start:2759 stop:2953 length:195 start_codon:yes stop_codon:yes gene_type:complete
MGTGTINSKKRYMLSLTEKHRKLDKEIITLYNNNTSDDIVKAKKTEKLHLKQKIATLEEQINNL